VELADKAGSSPAESDLKDIRAAITLTPDAQLCGQCHSQGTEPESKRPFPSTYRPGGDLLDKTVFSLVAPDSKDHWWPTGHASQGNMQFNEWLKSGHSKSLETLLTSKEAGPACLQCHSADYILASRQIAAQKAGTRKGAAPELPALKAAKYGVTCLACHNPHVATEGSARPDFILVADAYTLCGSCHRNTDVTPALHHPTREMFEGLPLVKGIQGIPSVHFSEPKGPRCQNCHLSRVPASGFPSASHLLLPVFPSKTEQKLPDSCTGCHSKLTPTDLQSLIDQTQDTVRGRLSVAFARLATVPKPQAGSPAAEQYDRVVNALAFVQNDGSLGVHNYAYADALLSASERTLTELSVPGAAVKPTEGPAPTATPSGPPQPETAREVSVPSGLRPITILSIGATLLTLLIGAFLFFRKFGRREI
jgi:predicted CXXCH cytochrome family protein